MSEAERRHLHLAASNGEMIEVVEDTTPAPVPAEQIIIGADSVAYVVTKP